MTASEAREIADEHIAYWTQRHVTPQQAIVMLTGARWWEPEWWMVRAWMIGWLLSAA